MNTPYFDFETQFYPGILDSFDGSCGRLLRSDRPQAILWLLVDHILLLFQSPVYVNLWSRGVSQYEALFSSISSQDRCFLGIRELRAEVLDGQQQDQLIFANEDAELVTSVRSLPNEKGLRPQPLHGAQTFDTIRRMLSCRKDQILTALKSYDEAAYESSGLTEPNSQLLDDAIAEAPRHLDHLRRRIGAVLDSTGRTELTETQNGKGLNLFAVIRWPSHPRVITPPAHRWDVPRSPSQYNYSVGLSLSLQQETSFKGGKEQATQLQMPLASGARSIADTPMTRGCVDFSLPNERNQREWSRQYYVGQENLVGVHRQSGEDALYEAVFGQQHADETIFYVPLHIGGVPWIALFTFNKSDRSPESMMRNYQFYRDLVPVLSESISGATQAAFAETLSQTATTAYDKHLGAATFVESVNSAWRVISQLYPYPAAQLTTEGRDKEKLQIPGLDQQIFMVFSESCSRLPYRLLEKDFVRQTVEQQLQRTALRVQSLYKEALFVFGHQAGKLFQESGLPGFDPRSNPRLRGMKNRLYHAWGMAEAISALKHLGRGFPDEWFPQPHPSEPPPAPEVIGNVKDICIFFLAGAVEMMPDDWTVIIETPGKINRLRMAQIKERFSAPLPILPPLADSKGGLAGTLALTGGLAELIRNARNHLQSNRLPITRGIVTKKTDDCVITLHVDCNQANGSCSVILKNLHMKGTSLHSQTLRNLQQFEKATLLHWGRIVVETTMTGPVKEIDEQFQWIESKWVYYHSMLSLSR